MAGLSASWYCPGTLYKQFLSAITTFLDHSCSLMSKVVTGLIISGETRTANLYTRAGLDIMTSWTPFEKHLNDSAWYDAFRMLLSPCRPELGNP